MVTLGVMIIISYLSSVSQFDPRTKNTMLLRNRAGGTMVLSDGKDYSKNNPKTDSTAAATIELQSLYLPSSNDVTDSADSADADADTSADHDEDGHHSILSSYTYSHCPFALAKFSQYRMAKKGPFSSSEEREINSMHRAELALNYSNDALAYERVLTSLQNGGFDRRKIVLDGDSLTRQLFISLGCLAWNAGYVEEYNLNKVHVNAAEENKVLKSAEFQEPSILYLQGQIHLKGGGEIYYNMKFPKDVVPETNEFVEAACNSNGSGGDGNGNGNETVNEREPIQAHVHNEILKMKPSDVYVISGGHHSETRDIYLTAYQKAFQCMKDAQNENPEADPFTKWPYFFYQSSSVASFWTETGRLEGEDNPKINGKDPNSCRMTAPFSPWRDEERELLDGDLVSFIGDSADVNKLGRLHPGHGDCLHWIQPGVPDVYAAELADFLLATKRKDN